MSLPLPGRDLQDVYGFGLCGFDGAVAAVTTRGFQMRRAVAEAEQLERALRPAREAHRLRRRDVARSAIAQLLFGLMRMATETLFVAREARFDTARVKLMAGAAIRFGRGIAHLAFVHVRTMREAVHLARDARQAEFAVARGVANQQRLIVARNAAIVASRAHRIFL
jgi:hypothetical protein